MDNDANQRAIRVAAKAFILPTRSRTIGELRHEFAVGAIEVAFRGVRSGSPDGEIIEVYLARVRDGLVAKPMRWMREETWLAESTRMIAAAIAEVRLIG